MTLIEALSKTRHKHVFERLSLFITAVDAPWTVRVTRKTQYAPLHITFAETNKEGAVWIFQSVNVQALLGQYQTKWRSLFTPKDPTPTEPWLKERLEMHLPNKLTAQASLLESLKSQTKQST